VTTLNEQANPAGLPKLLDTDDLATYLGISPYTVERTARAGLIPGAFQLENRAWRYPEDGVVAYIKAKQAQSATVTALPARPDPDGDEHGRVRRRRTARAS